MEISLPNEPVAIAGGFPPPEDHRWYMLAMIAMVCFVTTGLVQSGWWVFTDNFSWGRTLTSFMTSFFAMSILFRNRSFKQFMDWFN